MISIIDILRIEWYSFYVDQSKEMGHKSRLKIMGGNIFP